MVSEELWERARRRCSYCLKPVKRYKAVHVAGADIAHPSCYRRAHKEAK